MKTSKRTRFIGHIARSALDVAKGALTGRDGGRIVPGVARARPVQSDTTLPSDVDVAVIGGGYIGTLTALNMAERGVRVALFEKGVIAGESSGRSLGLVEGQFLDPSKVEIVLRSKALWSEMDARISGATGYRRNGFAGLSSDPDFLGFAEGWIDSVRDHPSIDARMLSRAEAGSMAGSAALDYAGGIYQASDAMVEPQLAAPAIAEAVRKAGGLVFQGCAVRGIETRAGRVCGVVTEKGVVNCGSVVVAGGIWSPLLLCRLGINLPQFMAYSSVVRLRARTGGPALPMLEGNSGLVLRPTAGGGLDACVARASAPIVPSLLANLGSLGPAIENLGGQIEPVWNAGTFLADWQMGRAWTLDEITPFEKYRIFALETRNRLLDEVRGHVGQAFPALNNAAIEDRWSGALMSTPDNMPVISGVDAIPGLFVGSGFYFGLTMAPAAGEALCDLVMGNAPKIDLGAYRLARFSDGSQLTFRH